MTFRKFQQIKSLILMLPDPSFSCEGCGCARLKTIMVSISILSLASTPLRKRRKGPGTLLLLTVAAIKYNIVYGQVLDYNYSGVN